MPHKEITVEFFTVIIMPHTFISSVFIHLSTLWYVIWTFRQFRSLELRIIDIEEVKIFRVQSYQLGVGYFMSNAIKEKGVFFIQEAIHPNNLRTPHRYTMHLKCLFNSFYLQKILSITKTHSSYVGKASLLRGRLFVTVWETGYYTRGMNELSWLTDPFKICGKKGFRKYITFIKIYRSLPLIFLRIWKIVFKRIALEFFYL